MAPTIGKVFLAFAEGKVFAKEAVSLLQKISSVHSSRFPGKADTVLDPFADKRVQRWHAERVRQDNRIGIFRATERLDGPDAIHGVNRDPIFQSPDAFASFAGRSLWKAVRSFWRRVGYGNEMSQFSVQESSLNEGEVGCWSAPCEHGLGKPRVWSRTPAWFTRLERRPLLRSLRGAGQMLCAGTQGV